MIQMLTKDRLILAWLAGVLALGAWLLWTPSGAPVLEQVASKPAVRQADGSLIAERQPLTSPPPPRHALPRGAVEERRARITVQPKPKAGSGPACECAPLDVDLSIVRDDEGGRRLIASAWGGELLSAVDQPILPTPLPPAPRNWAAGVSWSPVTRTPGAWVERDLGRVRLGAELVAAPGGVDARLRAGWVF